MRHISQEWSDEQLRILKQDAILSRVEQVIIDIRPFPEITDFEMDGMSASQDRKRYHETVRNSVASDVEVYRRSAKWDQAIGTAALASSGVYALSLRHTPPGSSRLTKALLSGSLLTAGALIRRYGSSGIRLANSVNDYLSETNTLYK